MDSGSRQRPPNKQSGRIETSVLKHPNKQFQLHPGNPRNPQPHPIIHKSKKLDLGNLQSKNLIPVITPSKKPNPGNLHNPKNNPGNQGNPIILIQPSQKIPVIIVNRCIFSA